jgi:hypothetical protein
MAAGKYGLIMIFIFIMTQNQERLKKFVKKKKGGEMKAIKSKACLQVEGWEDTGMKFGDCEIWRNGHQRLLYDPQTNEIVQVYWADERHLTGSGGSLSVGERSHE